MFSSLRRICTSQRIFLSYSSRDRALAEEIAQSLLLDGHTVFFDARSLNASEDYSARIRESVQKADKFIYLISETSIAAKAFTLTELAFAQKKWPSPAGRILPVLIDDGVPMDKVPVYLRAVHILQPHGNVPTEIAAAIQASGKVRPRCFAIAALLVAAICFAGVHSIFDLRMLGKGSEVVVAPPEQKKNSPAPSKQTLDGRYTAEVQLVRLESTNPKSRTTMANCVSGRKVPVDVVIEDKTIKISEQSMGTENIFFGKLDEANAFKIEGPLKVRLVSGVIADIKWRFSGLVTTRGILGDFQSVTAVGICHGVLNGTKQ